MKEDPEDDDINDDDEHIKSIYIEDEIEFLARKNDQL
jgi:hypothetical protein